MRRSSLPLAGSMTAYFRAAGIPGTSCRLIITGAAHRASRGHRGSAAARMVGKTGDTISARLARPDRSPAPLGAPHGRWLRPLRSADARSPGGSCRDIVESNRIFEDEPVDRLLAKRRLHGGVTFRLRVRPRTVEAGEVARP